MILITDEIVKEYDKGILDLLKEYTEYPDTLFKSHMWLTESPQKRAIYNLMYGDYLYNKTNHKILDVGGGYSSLTRLLIKNTAQYSVIDRFNDNRYTALPVRENILVGPDWYPHNPKEYDVVIANDLFPNVDQRLRIFLEKYRKVSHKIILSLTFHNNPKFYDVVRNSGDELMCMLAYTGVDIENILKDYLVNIMNPNFFVLDSKETVFPNGRQVCIVSIEGDL